MTPVVHPPSRELEGACAVALLRGTFGLHSGVLYRVEKTDPPRLLHLRWHLQLCDDTVSTGQACWVQPGFGRGTKNAVRTKAAVFAESNGKDIPYGLGYSIVFLEDGTLERTSRLGLNCASLVGAVFDVAGHPLVVSESWDQRDHTRRKEDDKVQAAVVEKLRKTDPKHAGRVQNTVGCYRIRPEEVAAASAHKHLPVGYEDAEPEGQAVATIAKQQLP